MLLDRVPVVCCWSVVKLQCAALSVNESAGCRCKRLVAFRSLNGLLVLVLALSQLADDLLCSSLNIWHSKTCKYGQCCVGEKTGKAEQRQ